jgi:hypothetical protein
MHLGCRTTGGGTRLCTSAARLPRIRASMAGVWLSAMAVCGDSWGRAAAGGLLAGCLWVRGLYAARLDPGRAPVAL